MKKLILALSLIFILYLLKAVPAPNTLISYTQPDGYSIQIKLIGDEWVHAAETIDGYTLLDQNGWKKYAILNSTGDLVVSGIVGRNPEDRDVQEQNFLINVSAHLWYSDRQISELREPYSLQRLGSFPHSGNVNLLVIPAQFTDMSMTYNTSTFNNLMNTPTNAVGCFKSYYEENSYNTFSITSTICPTVTVNGTHAGFGTETQWRNFAASAIQQANALIDLTNFDNNNNQQIEGVIIIHAGQGQETSGNSTDIWSHCANLSAPMNVDGMSISYYAIVGELGSFGMQAGVGVAAHEFGHLLGIPDFYNTNTGMDTNCVGEWDLMSTGAWNNMSWDPSHHNPWSKAFLNWMELTELEIPNNYTIQNSNINNIAYYVQTPRQGEYFLLENRQQTGYNNSIPGHGLLIYHVDHNYITSHLSTNDVNCSTHKGLMIEAANGDLDTAGAPFPEGTANSFTDETDPGSITSTDQPTERPIENITETGGNISFMYWNGPGYNPLIPPLYLNGYVTDSLSVKLEWEIPDMLGYDYEELSYSNLFCTHYFGLSVDPLEVAVKYNAGALDNYDGLHLHRVRFYAGDPEATYTVNVKSGADGVQLITSQIVETINSDGIADVLLDNPYLFNPDEELWITVECSPGSNNPIGSDGSTNYEGLGNLVWSNNSWVAANTLVDWDGDWCIEIVLTDIGYTRSYILDSYRIYKNNDLLVELQGWETTSYEELNAPEGEFDYTMTAVYAEGESEPSFSEHIIVDYNLVPAIWTDGFEDYANFIQSIYPWRSIDLDQTNNYQINTDFPGNGSVISFITFNPSATIPPLGGNWGAHTGVRELCAFAANPNQGSNNNDWLISPNYDVVTENSVFSFFAKTVDETYGMERFRVLVSTGSYNPADFIQISSGEFIEPPTTWTEYQFSLNDYIGQRVRVAINCVSDGTVALAIDDCTFDQRIANDENTQPALKTTLNDNYPNPFNPETTISFDLAHSTQVELTVYNLLGQKVNTLVNEVRESGNHNVVWNGLNEKGKNVSSGVYFYKLQAGTYTYTKKMILLK
ncbi:MAG: M6 family metalloprotease domain-containing protein [Candidatus Cloacimonetes bacterium]|nr:M6 family metalloprotease domain-containing protein [Candidatus Cloacimonadota bacterium]